MNNQFSVFINPRELANAAAFLEKLGSPPRSRNALVVSCVSYLADLAKEHEATVAFDETSGVEFLISRGLAGDTRRAAVASSENKRFTGVNAMAKVVAENIKLDRKLGKKVEMPAFAQPTEENILKAAQAELEKGTEESEVMEFLTELFGARALTESVREKLSVLFAKEPKTF